MSILEERTVNQTEQSELQDLRAQIAALKSQLVQAQRMTTLGELVSTTTHEFNNILMTILNYSKMGMRHEDKGVRAKAFEKIHMASQRAAKITGSILGMARNRSETFESTDLAVILEHSMILLEREMQKYRISVEIEVQEKVPRVSAIGNQIQQVLMNILINARQAMLDGGRLIIRLRSNLDNKSVELSIRDFGSGIPQDKLPRIFDSFYTTKSGPDETGKGGTGIGLSTCKSIMEQHGGRIRVESSVGKGTCFTLIFPIPVVPAAVQVGTTSASGSRVAS
jgi:two-component system, NtrC family, sensor kinase